MLKTGVLLVNLGTPDSARPRDVFRYLNEFLTDARVIDIPWLARQILVRGLIVPRRYRASAKSYSKIWTEKGSPLLLHSLKMKEELQKQLGDQYQVALGMRYQNPTMERALNELKHAEKIIVIPLFPQYASATTGSVHQKVMELVSKWQVIPKIHFVNSYATHPGLIEAFHVQAKKYDIKNFDHLIFSFHGLPQRHLIKSDPHGKCRKTKDCCKAKDAKHIYCYSMQCHNTAQAIADKLNLDKNFYTISFQSRLGKEPWMTPYTNEVIQEQLKKGHKNILVMSPSFVCDCLETIYEISMEYSDEFRHAGGDNLQLVEGLNNSPAWISTLHSLVKEHE
jgi:ferrochelatase